MPPPAIGAPEQPHTDFCSAHRRSDFTCSAREGSRLADSSHHRIVLTGFMGAGKSTLGPLLAAQLGWAFADLDCEVVRTQRETIAELFTRVGESGFRALEAAMLRQLLAREGLVIALGGGTLEGSDARSLLYASSRTHILYLETPLEIALARCAAQPGASERPILADRDGLARRFALREAEYRHAHQTVCTTPGEPAEIMQRLLAGLPGSIATRT